MEDLFDKVKVGAAKVMDNAEKFTNVAVKKTKDVIEQTKYSYTLSGIENKISEILAELGTAIYAEYENGADLAEDIKSKCKQIEVLKKDIKELKEKMAELKNSVLCSQCGAVVSEESMFCPKCGMKMKD